MYLKHVVLNKKARYRDYLLYDCISRKFLEKEKLQRQKDQCCLQPEMESVLNAMSTRELLGVQSILNWIVVHSCIHLLKLTGTSTYNQ